MEKLKVVKTVTGLIIGMGVKQLAENVVKNTTPTGIDPFSKICIKLGSYVLTAMISELAAVYAVNKLEGTVNDVKSMITTE